MWTDDIMEQRENQAHGLSSEPVGTMANPNRRIKASSLRNMELFPGLTSILASWSVSACLHESFSLGLRKKMLLCGQYIIYFPPQNNIGVFTEACN